MATDRLFKGLLLPHQSLEVSVLNAQPGAFLDTFIVASSARRPPWGPSRTESLQHWPPDSPRAMKPMVPLFHTASVQLLTGLWSLGFTRRGASKRFSATQAAAVGKARPGDPNGQQHASRALGYPWILTSAPGRLPFARGPTCPARPSSTPGVKQVLKNRT